MTHFLNYVDELYVLTARDISAALDTNRLLPLLFFLFSIVVV